MSGDGEGAAASDVITLKITSSGRDEMLFKVKKTTKMQKVMDAYAGRIGVGAANLRFMFDGVKVTPDATPKMMEMEDNDQIDVLLEQVGGL